MNDDQTDQMIENNKQELQQEKSNIAKTGENIARKTIQQATKKGVKGKVVSQAVASSLAGVLPYIIVAILIIIIVIGLVGFFITLPGLIKGKLTGFFNGISDWWKKLYTSEAMVNVKDEDIVEMGNYIADMGYDLIGFGFITPKDEGYIMTSETLENDGYTEERDDEAGTVKYVKDDGSYYEDVFIYKDGRSYNGKTGEMIQYISYENNGEEVKNTSDYTKYGIQYDSSGKISSFEKVDSSLLRKYAISNNRIFVIRNSDKNDNIVNWFHNLFYDDKVEANAWSKGLISLYHAENFKATEAYDSSIFGTSIKVTQGSDGSRSLKVDSFNNNEMNFDLDGWTGRYGLSQDFLIALHLATLSPDLVEQMVENFDTEVQVYLDKVSNKGDKDKDEISWAEAKVVDSVSSVYGLKDGQDVSDEDVGLTVKDLPSVGVNANDKGLDIAAWWINNDEAVDFFYNTEMAGHKYCTNGYRAGIPNHVLPSGDVNGFTGGFDAGLNMIDNLNGDDGYIVQNVPNYILDQDDSTAGLNTVSYNMAEVVRQFVNQLDGRYNFDKDDFYSKVHLEDDDKCSIKALVNNVDNPFDIIKFTGRWTYNGETVDQGYYGLRIEAQDDIMEKVKSKVEGYNSIYSYPLMDYFSETFFKDSGRTQLEGYMSPEATSDNSTVCYWGVGDSDIYYVELENVGTTCVYEFNDNLNHETDHINTFDCNCDFCTTFWNKWTRGFQVEWDKEGGDACFDPSIVTIAQIPGDDVNKMSAVDLYSWYSDYKDPNTGLTETIQYNITFYFPKMTPKSGKICITRSWTTSEAQEIQSRQDEITTCYEQVVDYKNEGKSAKDVRKKVVVCSQCKSYIHDLIKSLLKVNDNDFTTEIPYIARVVNSWFRDTYFIIPENSDPAIEEAEKDYPYYKEHPLYGDDISVIENNDEILENTGELWTKYVMYKDNYALFWINNNGDLFKSEDEVTEFLDYLQSEKGLTDDERAFIEKDTFLDKKYEYSENSTSSSMVTYALWKAETEEDLQSSQEKKANDILEKYGISLVKIPINKTVDKLDQDGEKVKDIAWNAYGLTNDENSVKWQTMDVNESSPDYLSYVINNYGGEENGGTIEYYVGLHNVFNLTQVRDAQRGMTNSKIKYMFKNRKYYKYDGSIQRSYDIYNDWNECIDLFGNSEEDLNKVLKDYYFNGTVSTSHKFARDFDDDGIADIASPNITTDEYDGLTITEDTEKTYDPRNPGLIDKIDLTLESLNAFSILENTPSEDAEYAYRDLKELLVELDYFDTEDLMEPAKDVLEWLLPDSGSYGWPNRTFDKNSQYGTLIHSKDMYDTLDKIYVESEIYSKDEIIEKYVEIIESYDDILNNSEIKDGELLENLNFKLSSIEDLIDVIDDYLKDTSIDNSKKSEYQDIKDTYNKEKIEVEQSIDKEKKEMAVNSKNVNEDQNQIQAKINYDVLNKVAISSRASNKSGNVEYQEVTDPDMHCESITIINGVEYRNYKQGYYEWGSIPYSQGNMSGSACGATSCAVVLSGYGNDLTPKDTGGWISANHPGAETNAESLVSCLTNYGVPAKADYSSSHDEILNKIRQAWNEGKPVIANVGVGQMTKTGHYIVILGEVDGKVVISQVGGNNYAYIENGYLYADGDLATLDSKNYIKGIIIPDEAPTGFKHSNSSVKMFEGFEKNQPIVSPATAKVLEIGTVTVNNETKESFLDTYYISDEDTSSQSVQQQTTENDEGEDGDETKKIVVNRDEYETINLLAEETQNDESNPFGKSYTTGYVKLEVIGKETIERFESLNKSKIAEGMNAFYDDYYNDANHKSVCDSFTIYIEGIDLTGELESGNALEEDLSNTILAKLFNENTDGEEFTSSSYTTSNDTNNSDTSSKDTNNSETSSDDSSDSDSVDLTSLSLNYYTPREAPKYYTSGAKRKLEQKENKKAELPSVIKLDVEDAENNNGEIYVKAGTILGVAGNANIKIIMKDKDNAVVENVEEYLEIEDAFGNNTSSKDIEKVYGGEISASENGTREPQIIRKACEKFGFRQEELSNVDEMMTALIDVESKYDLDPLAVLAVAHQESTCGWAYRNNGNLKYRVFNIQKYPDIDETNLVGVDGGGPFTCWKSYADAVMDFGNYVRNGPPYKGTEGAKTMADLEKFGSYGCIFEGAATRDAEHYEKLKQYYDELK